MQRKCAYCLLPISLHFGFCHSSGIKGVMPPEAFRPGAIRSDPRELRWINPIPSERMKPERRGK
jgi:hypothetical protein